MSAVVLSMVSGSARALRTYKAESRESPAVHPLMGQFELIMQRVALLGKAAQHVMSAMGRA